MLLSKRITDAELKTFDHCFELEHTCGKKPKWGYCCLKEKCHPIGMCKMYHCFNKWYCRTGQGALHVNDEECCGQEACHQSYNPGNPSITDRKCTNQTNKCKFFD